MSDPRVLYRRYVAAYNQIEALLREKLKEPGASFRKLVERYAQWHPWWKDKATLHVLADLRNVIVHRETDLERPLFHPSEHAVGEVEGIVVRLREAVPFIQKYPRTVLTVASEDTVEKVLQLVSENDFSQFPVYSGSVFVGLLTENGITRWLAREACTGLMPSLRARVAELLTGQEHWKTATSFGANCEFTHETASVEEVLARFLANPVLEAIIVTRQGKSDEPPLSIATQWDALAGA